MHKTAAAVSAILLALMLRLAAAQCPSPSPTPRPSPTPTPIPTGTTHYVAPNGSDGNSGNQGAPWATIQHAANVMSPGDTAIVATGNYPELVTVSHSGTASKPITFQVATGAQATMKGFELDASYIQVNGFDITNHNQSDPSDWGVHLVGSNDLVNGNTIHDLCAEGVFVEPGTANNVISYNNFIRDEMAGGQIDGRNTLVTHNTVSGTLQYPPGCYSRDGADADGFRFFGSGHIFRSNLIENIPVPGSQYNPDPHTDCFQSWGPATDMTFDSNWCQWPRPASSNSGTNNEMGMIENFAGSVSNLMFMNNVFVNMDQGINVDGNGGDISGLQFDNNTVDNVNEEALIFIEHVTGAQVLNNIFYNVGGGGDNYLSDGSGDSYTAEFNDMWMTSGSPGTYGSNAAHLTVNPMFVNPAGLNFHLAAGSPLINAGANLPQITHNYDGTARPPTDIGAY